MPVAVAGAVRRHRDLGSALVDDAAAGRRGAGPRRAGSGSALLRTHLRDASAPTSTRTPSARTSSLGPAQVQRAVRAAQAAALLDGGRVTADDLRRGVRAQNAAGLERLARRIEPEVELGRPGAGPGVRRALRGAGRPGPAPRPGARRLADAPGRRPRPRRDRAVRRRLRHRQDHVRRGDRRRPGAGPLHGQPGHGRGQVRRGDREEPRADLRRGRRGQRRAVLRRGGRDLRQAQRGARRPRPVRQHRERLPAAAAGDLRRAGRPRHQPAGQHRRGLHPPAGRDHRLPRPDPGPARARCGASASRRRCRVADDVDLEFCAESFELAGGNIRSAATTAAYLAAEDRGSR